MRGASRSPAGVDDQFSRILLVAVALLGFGAALFTKGPFLDEYFTTSLTDPAIPLDLAFRMWSADTGHPVGFYAAARAFAEFLPSSIYVGRALNLIPLAALLWLTIFSSRTACVRTFAVFFMAIVSASYFALERFAEYRSYFTAMMLLSMLIVVVARTFAERPGEKLWRWDVAGLSGAIAVFNYPMFCAALALLAVGGVVLFLAARRRDAAAMAVGALIGVALVAASLINAFGYEQVAAPDFVTMNYFARFAAKVMISAGAANLVLTGLALAAAVSLVRARPMPAGLHELARTAGLPLCLVLATILTLCGFAAINLKMPAMYQRQLLGLLPLTAAVIAWFAARWAKPVKLRLAFFLAMAMGIAGSLYVLKEDRYLARYAPMLAEHQKDCRSFRVFAFGADDLYDRKSRHFIYMRQKPLQAGYADVAGMYGFTLSDDGSRRFDESCGGAVWLEHVWLTEADTAADLLDKLHFSLTPAQRNGATLLASEFSNVVLVPAAGGQAGR